MSRAGETPARPGLKKAGMVGSVMVMMGALTALLATWEGKSNDPYLDSVGVRTVCYGETRVEMRRYSDAECRVMLEEGAAEFAEAVRKRNPDIANYPYQWAAHTSLAYNIGIAAYNRSSVARLFGEGKHREACEFIGRFRMAGGKVLRGLVLRRQGDARRIGEVEVCLTGMSKA
jgi:lysozyme